MVHHYHFENKFKFAYFEIGSLDYQGDGRVTTTTAAPTDLESVGAVLLCLLQINLNSLRPLTALSTCQLRHEVDMALGLANRRLLRRIVA